MSPIKKRKLDSIARCLSRIENKCPASSEILKSDVDLQEILVLNLERLVQLTVDLAAVLISESASTPLPDSMKANFAYLKDAKVIDARLCGRLVELVDFRNLCFHEYDKLNWDIVYKIATDHLEDFREFSRIINSI